MGATIYARSISNNGLDDRSRELSSKYEHSDSAWEKYLGMTGDEKGATFLRSDPAFLDNLLKILETNINEIVRVK